jgi:hypothetical protein
MKKAATDDDFSPTTKRELADRAGHHCSLCLALTTCSDAHGKPFRIADAAHQASAAKTGPRYDPDQTAAQRSSIENAIWLCSLCHRKIDGDKYRYSVEDLRQMKAEAEDRARRMVHGELVFEMKSQEIAAIEHYFGSRPLENKLPKSGFGEQGANVPKGGMLGVQIVPYSTLTQRPNLDHATLFAVGVPTSERIIQSPNTDSKGASASTGFEVSRIDRDATAQTWIGYPRTANPEPGWVKGLPGTRIAEDILKYLKNVREVFKRHGIRDQRLIVRARFENVQDKILWHSSSDGIPVTQVTVETNFRTIDVGEEEKFLEELWYCMGSSHGLPDAIANLTVGNASRGAGH